METAIQHFDTIARCNEAMGLATAHPLACVADLSQLGPTRHRRITFGFYVIFLKDEKNCEITYGRQRYDYTKGSVICLAPGQIIGIEDTGRTMQPLGQALCFDRQLIRGTKLGRQIREYGFFGYEANEALHLSVEERAMFVDGLAKIKRETERAPDAMTDRLIVTNIHLLLDYCLRFYDRQFASRAPAASDILTRFEKTLHGYFEADRPQREGLPSVKTCAAELGLSPNYLGDLIKKETGRTAQEHIRQSIIEAAKEELLHPELSVGEISYGLGFRYPQHFTRMFKKIVGLTPQQFRAQA